MSDIYASNTRMLGFSLPALGLNSLLVSVFVFLPTLYAEQGGLDAATVGLSFVANCRLSCLRPGRLMDSSRPLGAPAAWLAGIVHPGAGCTDGLNPPETASGLYLFFSLTLL